MSAAGEATVTSGLTSASPSLVAAVPRLRVISWRDDFPQILLVLSVYKFDHFFHIQMTLNEQMKQ